MLVTSGSRGGGLYFQKATTVIILSPEWTPAKEDQLVGRAYRIGQTQQVQVYRLLAKNSMDVRVLELQRLKNSKRNALLDLHMTKDDNITETEADEREETLHQVDEVRGWTLEEFQEMVGCLSPFTLYVNEAI